MEQAINLRKQLRNSDQGKRLSQRLAVDLAHACYATGHTVDADQIMHQVAAENNEDPHLIGHITSVFEKTGQPDAGKALLDRVGKEIVELNNRGVMAARSGDLEGAVQLLIQAAEQVPNLQFLVNAAKAIYTLMEKKGWDNELATRALDYLEHARRKDPKSAKVASARALYLAVAKKNGITVSSH